MSARGGSRTLNPEGIWSLAKRVCRSTTRAGVFSCLKHAAHTEPLVSHTRYKRTRRSCEHSSRFDCRGALRLVEVHMMWRAYTASEVLSRTFWKNMTKKLKPA